MKHITLGYFLCILSCNALGMKRPLSLTTKQPEPKRLKVTPQKELPSEVSFSKAEEQSRTIIAHLNNALSFLGHAQAAVERSNQELELRISQLHREVAHAHHFVSLLTHQQIHFDQLFLHLQKTRNHLAHYLENTKNNIVDTTFSIAFSQPRQPIPSILLQTRPKTPPMFIDVETSDEPTIDITESAVEAIEVHTATVAVKQSDRLKNKNSQKIVDIDVEG